jgi:hypothetical protein
MLFGLAECARSAQCQDLLKSGNMEGFGQLKYLSHDGDRQFTLVTDGSESQQNNRITDTALDILIADLESKDSARISAAQIYNQPGGYDCSCRELDQLVDLASQVDGVVGAGLTGGGLGGCVLVFVREEAVDSLLSTLETKFYTPRGLSDAMLVCASVAGSGLI